jgi:hypothetical protein
MVAISRREKKSFHSTHIKMILSNICTPVYPSPDGDGFTESLSGILNFDSNSFAMTTPESGDGSRLKGIP